jgi:hypothetical protein
MSRRVVVQGFGCMFVFSDTRPVWSIAPPVRSLRRQVLLTAELTRAEARAYDQFVATAPSGHYSQTRAWARVVAAEKAVEPLFFLTRNGREVIGAGLVLRPILGGLPLPTARLEQGPVVALPEDLPEVLDVLRQSCLAKGILRLSVTPHWSDPDRLVVEHYLAAAGFPARRGSGGRLAHVKRLDLTTLHDIQSWSARPLIEIRQDIGLAVRAGATVRPGRREDLAVLQDMSGRSSGWRQALGDYFQGRSAAMFVAEYQGSLASAVFVILHNGLATAARVFSIPRPLPFWSIVLTMTEAVQWARRMGAQAFEVPEENSNLYCRTEALLVGEHVRWF